MSLSGKEIPGGSTTWNSFPSRADAICRDTAEPGKCKAWERGTANSHCNMVKHIEKEAAWGIRLHSNGPVMAAVLIEHCLSSSTICLISMFGQ